MEWSNVLRCPSNWQWSSGTNCELECYLEEKGRDRIRSGILPWDVLLLPIKCAHVKHAAGGSEIFREALIALQSMSNSTSKFLLLEDGN